MNDIAAVAPLAGTLRRPEDLAARGLVPPAEVAELNEVAARYAVAITPAMAALIDPDRCERRDRAPVPA